MSRLGSCSNLYLYILTQLNRKCLQSPFYFTVANLVTEQDPETPLLPAQNYLSGSTVSSLYRLRDIDNSDGGFFVFGDLAVKKEGKFKLRFSLFEIVEGQVQNRKTILSDTFTVFLPKHFPGPVEATFLSRTFSDQGVKMRIRKEHRLQSRKRKAESNESSSASATTNETKKYQSKKANMMISSSPRYADSSSTSTPHSDVFFGRWQATTVKSDHHHHHHSPPSEHQRQRTLSGHTTPPPQQNNISDQESDYKGLTNKFRYQQSSDPTKAFPSPESTIYSSSTSSQQQYHERARSLSWGQQQQQQQNQRSNSSPRLSSFVALNYFTVSPPSMSMQLPPPSTHSGNSSTITSLAKYHTCLDNTKYKKDRLPTSPSSITEITGDHSWGTQLPPLRAIMNGIQQSSYQQHTSSSMPLILPPPTPMMIDSHHHYGSSASPPTSYPSFYR